MDALDGNAIAGHLWEVFGAEMTVSRAVCVHCGNEAPVAEAVVYNRAPGTVVRCPTCINVLMVLVQVRGTTCLDLSGLATLDPPS
jgi:ribosomal protein S27E